MIDFTTVCSTPLAGTLNDGVGIIVMQNVISGILPFVLGAVELIDHILNKWTSINLQTLLQIYGSELRI